MRSHRVPAYRLHTTKQLAYVRLAGRMVYLGRAGSTQSIERYRRVVAEWLATGQVSRRQGERAASLTIADLVEAYLRWARAYYLDADGLPSPGLGPIEAAARTLCSLYGSTPADAFGPVALRAVRQAMVASDLCRNVANQRTACVKRIFRWAVAEELLTPAVLQALSAVDPLRAGRSGARETPPVGPVPDADIAAVLPFLPPTLRAMVQLQRLTGMRSGELCRMRTGEVDVSDEVWIYSPSAHKTAYRGHARAIYLGPKAQALIRSYLSPTQPNAFLFSPARAVAERRRARRDGGSGDAPLEPREAVVAQASTSARYNPRSYRRALSYAMSAATRAGAMTADAHWFPHQLRHRHATAIRQSKGLEAARVMLGHSTLAQTLEYAEADRAVAIAVAHELA